ncbi:hypothetical protein T492DRAFT_833767 [Pavlovales sp. CCMP2436]|nr:hypothetical protein T492DRAFT_833767 [Pavlovales sp. CCMP2436]
MHRLLSPCCATLLRLTEGGSLADALDAQVRASVLALGQSGSGPDARGEAGEAVGMPRLPLRALLTTLAPAAARAPAELVAAVLRTCQLQTGVQSGSLSGRLLVTLKPPPPPSVREGVRETTGEVRDEPLESGGILSDSVPDTRSSAVGTLASAVDTPEGRGSSRKSGVGRRLRGGSVTPPPRQPATAKAAAPSAEPVATESGKRPVAAGESGSVLNEARPDSLRESGKKGEGGSLCAVLGALMRRVRIALVAGVDSSSSSPAGEEAVGKAETALVAGVRVALANGDGAAAAEGRVWVLGFSVARVVVAQLEGVGEISAEQAARAGVQAAGACEDSQEPLIWWPGCPDNSPGLASLPGLSPGLSRTPPDSEGCPGGAGRVWVPLLQWLCHELIADLDPAVRPAVRDAVLQLRKAAKKQAECKTLFCEEKSVQDADVQVLIVRC